MSGKSTKKTKRSEAKIPDYVDLAENLYRPGMQHLRYVDDVVSKCKCSLESGGCGDNCLNRILYMYSIHFLLV